ncbi:MAG: hypothetical protein LBT12_00910, partial [Oscillospiraceae bacterium]|nr:hypothetical protein [Oscillospiraceae bacterium]
APIPDSITAWDGHVIVKERSDMDFSAPGLYDIAENTIYLIDVNGDGVTEEVSISNTTFTHMVEWPDGTTFESTSQGELYVTVNGKDGESLVSPQYAEDAHFLRRENGAVALIFIGRENDYSDLFIFAFRDTAPVLMEYRSFLRFTSLTPSSLTLEGRYFFFGNMGVTIDCVLNEDFSLTLANDGFFEVTRFIVDYLITKLPLDAELKTGGEYRDATLPVGSKIRPTFVSETGCMIFETSDGRTGRLFTDGRTINGVSEYDMFENVKYVGV